MHFRYPEEPFLSVCKIKMSLKVVRKLNNRNNRIIYSFSKFERQKNTSIYLFIYKTFLFKSVTFSGLKRTRHMILTS